MYSGRPGLTRSGFDIDLESAPDEASAAREKPSLFTALQEQAGLRLEARKVAMEVLAVIKQRRRIDHSTLPVQDRCLPLPRGY